MRRDPRFDDSEYPVRMPWRPWMAASPTLIRLGKTAEAINSGGTATVDLYEGSTIGSETTTGDSVEAYNRGATIASGVWVNVIFRYDSSDWEVFPLECNP